MAVKEKAQLMLQEMSKLVVGQDEFLRHMLVAFFSEGHVLMEGVPGLGKTLCAKALAQTIDADYKRIQFTPDLMPSDILGTNVFDLKESEFYLKKGPVFTNILLADEINRTPPKTQSALLEAMEEMSVTIDGRTMPLDPPFFVIATQNPVEYEGTYPLPEAQLDRFLMKLYIDYVEQKYENDMLMRYTLTTTTGDIKEAAKRGFGGAHKDINTLQAVVNSADLQECRTEIMKVRVDEGIINYITSIVLATRRSTAVMLGGSPRASIALLLCARTVAAMNGRDFVTPEDVVDISLPVLRHRIILKPEAGIDGMSADSVLMSIIRKVEIPR